MNNQNSSLFDLGIDDIGQAHFISIAKWNKFLAWVGIIGCGLGLLAIIFGRTFFMDYITRNSGTGITSSYASSSFAAAFIFYALLIIVFAIPCFFRLNFANKMLKALGTNDQNLLNDSLSDLKSFSKFWGILTIIIIGLYAVLFLIILIGIAASR